MSRKMPFVHLLRWAGAAVMLLLIGMIMVEGTWGMPLHRSWPFVLTVLAAVVLLVVAGVRDLKNKAWMAALSHWGLTAVLLGGMLGAVVETDVKMVVDANATERVAYSDRGETVVLPFSIRLEDFRIDYYDGGVKPKQYTSAIILSPADKASLSSQEGACPQSAREVSVNHPLRYHGWWIYQQDYDRERGEFVILQLVRDPWLPLVYAGFALMLLGAFCQVRKAWHSWKVWPATIVVAGIFTAASLARIELGTLVPALRSIWFFPHILVYMIAYALLAIALILKIVDLCIEKSESSISHAPFSIDGQLSDRLLTTVSALLLIGMLCGAVWAKEAWGQYWTWDAKENWAAVTWLITVVGQHVRGKRLSRSWHTFIFVLLTFAAMQMTWYGVNYLPAAQYSMHTYNS